jgi:uncharacterized membrane protein YkoI
MRDQLLTLAAAVSLAVVSPAAAQSVGQPAHTKVNAAGFNKDPHALPNAVKAIEDQSGGRVAAIRYDNAAGVPSYDVVLEQGKQVKFQRYAMPIKQGVELTDKTTPEWMLGWRDRREVGAVQTAKVSLVDAIRTAEASQEGAPAVAAGIARSASNPTAEVRAYNVTILRGGAEHRVAVDTDSGSVIADPGALRW